MTDSSTQAQRPSLDRAAPPQRGLFLDLDDVLLAAALIAIAVLALGAFAGQFQ